MCAVCVYIVCVVIVCACACTFVTAQFSLSHSLSLGGHIVQALSQICHSVLSLCHSQNNDNIALGAPAYGYRNTNFRGTLLTFLLADFYVDYWP